MHKIRHFYNKGCSFIKQADSKQNDSSLDSVPLGTRLSHKGIINKASIICTPRTIHCSRGKEKKKKKIIKFELNSQESLGKGPSNKKSISQKTKESEVE